MESMKTEALNFWIGCNVWMASANLDEMMPYIVFKQELKNAILEDIIRLGKEGGLKSFEQVNLNTNQDNFNTTINHIFTQLISYLFFYCQNVKILAQGFSTRVCEPLGLSVNLKMTNVFEYILIYILYNIYKILNIFYIAYFKMYF